MTRASYKGSVRDSAAEMARDARMLALFKQGVAINVIATRMGVSRNSVRQRIKRVSEGPGRAPTPLDEGSTSSGQAGHDAAEG